MAMLENTFECTNSIGALIVFYYPDDAQAARAIKLKEYTFVVTIVDNSPKENREMAAQFAALGIDYLHNGNVGGIAGAFNLGIRHIFSQSCEVAALFDQDSRPSDDFFPIMHSACLTLGFSAYVIGPRIYDENAKRFLPLFSIHGKRLKKLIFDNRAKLQRCAFLISSGSIISRTAFETIGNFDEQLFIDHVDTDSHYERSNVMSHFMLIPNLH
jgi:rhamnosyltransferase